MAQQLYTGLNRALEQISELRERRRSAHAAGGMAHHRSKRPIRSVDGTASPAEDSLCTRSCRLKRNIRAEH
jgi:hypothetical protein